MCPPVQSKSEFDRRSARPRLLEYVSTSRVVTWWNKRVGSTGRIIPTNEQQKNTRVGR